MEEAEIKKALKDFADTNTGTVFVDEAGEILYMTRTLYKKKEFIVFKNKTYTVVKIEEKILNNGYIQSVMTVKPLEDEVQEIINQPSEDK